MAAWMAGTSPAMTAVAWHGNLPRLRQRAGRDRPTSSAECLRSNSSKPNQNQTKPDQENGLGFSWIPSSDSGLFNGYGSTKSKWKSEVRQPASDPLTVSPRRGKTTTPGLTDPSALEGANNNLNFMFCASPATWIEHITNTTSMKEIVHCV